MSTFVEDKQNDEDKQNQIGEKKGSETQASY